MESFKESGKPILQLHVYLDKESICIRSYVECEIPYFEVDAPYDSQTQSLLTAIIDEEMDERLSPLFYGIKQDLMNSKIFCTINDYRTPLSSSRTFILKNKCKEKSYDFIAHTNENQNTN